MFNTVFDAKFGDWIYGDTCTDNKYGYARAESKGTKFNFFTSTVKLSTKVAVATAAFSATLSFPENSFAPATGEWLKTKNIRFVFADSALPTKLDERGRQELVRKLLKIREDFSLSQDDLAKLLDVSKFTLSKLERGEHSPDATNLMKYNKFLELSEYLLDKLNGKKYAIRQLFLSKSPVFDKMNPIDYAHELGEEGLNEVIYAFKRQYG